MYYVCMYVCITMMTRLAPNKQPFYIRTYIHTYKCTCVNYDVQAYRVEIKSMLTYHECLNSGWTYDDKKKPQPKTKTF